MSCYWLIVDVSAIAVVVAFRVFIDPWAGFACPSNLGTAGILQVAHQFLDSNNEVVCMEYDTFCLSYWVLYK